MHKYSVGILGASGYAGRELCGLVLRHPGLHLAFASANERRGECVRIAGRAVTFDAPDDVALDRVDLVFAALPHGASAPWVARARDAGARVVDLSSDLRPGQPHDHGGLAAGVPYGLTELARDQVRAAPLVANPGCYATGVLLALAPLFEAGLVPADALISVAAASGVTGAGMSPRPDLLFGEVTEDFRAYAVANSHRHLPEMRATLAALGGAADLVFTPHLLPVARGILATITVPLTEPLDDPLSPWRTRYAGEPFVEVGEGLPTLRDVAHRNVIQITARSVEGVRQPTLLVLSAIDNLVKGAAGQALQNANLMLGVDETAGLPR